MSRLVATIDLSSAVVGSQGSFETQTPNNCSALYVMNESAAFLQLDLGVNGQPIVQPWRNRLFTLKQSIQNAQWTVIATLQSGGAPSNAVYVEAFAPNETPNATLDGPVFRQSNVGNSVPVGTSAASIANDGNVAGTVFVEATPSGAASSQVKITNDGDFLCGGGLFHISNAGVVTAIPSGAIPATALAAGTLLTGMALAKLLTDSGALASDGTGILTWNRALSAANQLADLQQGYGLWSDNAATVFPGGTTRLWFDAPANGEMHFGGRGGAILAGVRYLANELELYNGSAAATTHGFHAGTGNGSGTYTHGLSVTPTAMLCNTANGSNSTTFGSGSYGTATAFLYEFNTQPFVWLAWAN